MPCSLVQLARVVVCVRVLVDVIGVMIVVLIGRHTVDVVGAVLVAIFVVIFCNWRCTLYSCDEKTVSRCGVSAFHPVVQPAPEVHGQQKDQRRSMRDTWGSTSLWLILLCGLVWESLCAPNQSTKGQSSRELYRCGASASGFKTIASCR